VRPSRSHSASSTVGGVTLTELLVTLSVIAVLAGLTIPTWGAITRSRAPKAAASTVMECLERARSEAITTRRGVWVLFRQGKGDAVRIVAGDGGSPVALGPWFPLPSVILFDQGQGNLLSEQPPRGIVDAAYNGKTPDTGIRTGGVMFARTGGIALPARGGNALRIGFSTRSGAPLPGITLSRGTGRAERISSP